MFLVLLECFHEEIKNESSFPPVFQFLAIWFFFLFMRCLIFVKQWNMDTNDAKKSYTYTFSFIKFNKSITLVKSTQAFVNTTQRYGCGLSLCRRRSSTRLSHAVFCGRSYASLSICLQHRSDMWGGTRERISQPRLHCYRRIKQEVARSGYADSRHAEHTISLESWKSEMISEGTWKPAADKQENNSDNWWMHWCRLNSYQSPNFMLSLYFWH